MKCFYLLSLIATGVYGQTLTPTVIPSECSNYIEGRISPRGEALTCKEILTVSNDNGKTGIKFFCMLSTDKQGLIFQAELITRDICMTKESTIEIMFDDNSFLFLTIDGKINCNSAIAKYFGGAFGGLDSLKKLTTKSITYVSINTATGPEGQVIFDKEQSNNLKNTLKCLEKYLIK